MITNKATSAAVSPPGIVIQQPLAPEPRPSITAFIWGGKIAPVPALPYGRAKS